MSAEQLVRASAVLLAAAVLGLLAGWCAGMVTSWLARRARRHGRFLNELRRSCHRPTVALLFLWALYVALPMARFPAPAERVIRHVLLLALIAATTWLVVRVLFVFEDAAFRWIRVDVVDNRRARRVRTQIGILRRLTTGMATVFAIAAMLMTFESLRAVGASLLVSAGVLGAVAGLAAQATLGHVFAGLQLAMTDALRFDDVLVVDGEWGRVEELTLTYIVLRLWDERRLVLPTTYLTQRPFQNWTRNESRVLGAIVLHLDYLAPVDELRAEARRAVEESPLWDRRDWVLQVVESTPATMVVRVLASSADAPSSWDLRCEVLERLINYLKVHHPEAVAKGCLAQMTSPASHVPQYR